jgi:hypothetical protein
MRFIGARRNKVLWTVALACVVLGGIVVAVLRSGGSPGTFTLHDVQVSEMTPARPRSVYGDIQVEAEFDHTGPPITGGQAGAVTRFLRHFKLIKPVTMVWRNEDATLTDPAGREVQRYVTTALPAAAATTRPIARVDLMEDAAQQKIHVLFNFDVPPSVDRSKPLTFRTRFGLNSHPAVTIEGTVPAAATPRPATAPVLSSP